MLSHARLHRLDAERDELPDFDFSIAAGSKQCAVWTEGHGIDQVTMGIPWQFRHGLFQGQVVQRHAIATRRGSKGTVTGNRRSADPCHRGHGLPLDGLLHLALADGPFVNPTPQDLQLL